MIDNSFRQLLPKFVSPLIGWYQRRNLTPNQITVLGLVGALLASLSIAYKFYILGICLWWLSRLLDGTDGIYARQSNMSSHFGAYLDFLSDMAAYGAMIIGFKVAFPEFTNLWLLVLFLYILCSVSALLCGNVEKELGIQARDNRGLRLGAGLAEAGETGIAYTLMALFPQHMLLWLYLWLGVLLATVAARTKLVYGFEAKR